MGLTHSNETSEKLTHTLAAYGRLERKHYAVKREVARLRAALDRITQVDSEGAPVYSQAAMYQFAADAIVEEGQ